MPGRKKKYRLPYWIRSQEFRLLNNSEKDFLGYLYSFGPDTCWLWNWRLEKKFHRCRRTIQYWLAKLKDLGFVWIEKPFGPERKIHARPMPSPEHWVKLIGTLALGKTLRKRKGVSQRRIAPIRKPSRWSSTAFVEQTKRDIINELMKRGETLAAAANIANIIIMKQRQKEAQKKGLRGCKKLHP